MDDKLMVTGEDSLLAKWKSRKHILGGSIRNVRERAIVLSYLEHLAMSLRTTDFLATNDLRWLDLSPMLAGTHYPLVKVAMQIGSMLKLRLAEDELQRRSIEGIEEPVYQGCKLVGYKKKYSDSLLTLLLKAEDPDKYSDKQQVDVKGAVLHVNVTGVTRNPL